MMYRISLAFLGALVAALGFVRRVGASAEWCEHDDFMLHDTVDGKHLAIHCKVLQLSPKAQLKDWSPAGNIRLWTNIEPHTTSVRIVGPQFEWKANVFANHDFAMDADMEKVYDAGQVVVFTLRAA